MTDQELFAYTQERGKLLNEATRSNKYQVRDAEEAPDTLLREAIRHFSHDVYNKAMLARDKYGFHPLGWATPDWQEELQKGIAEHLQKGDPRDVAVYAMFAWFHGWGTATPAPATCIVEAAAEPELSDSLLIEIGGAAADVLEAAGTAPRHAVLKAAGRRAVKLAFPALANTPAARVSSSLGGEAGEQVAALKDRVEVAEARVKVMQADVAKQIQAARLDIAREIYRAVMREASEDVCGEDNEFKQGIAHERRLIHKWASERFPGPTQEEKDQFNAS
jgi:hypothetical protein